MDIVDLLLGTPLATEDEKAERIGAVKGIPIFGLDALSSAAYGPEAALTLLIPLGMAGVAYILPITAAIVVLLAIVYFSYRQTMQAYPQGGGSYTVASENLGTGAGLLAAAALMIDYVLTAAVGISAGVGALVSAVPSLQPHTLAMCLGILLLLGLVNLRGVRETGGIFMIPTYLFIACLIGMIAIGVVKALLAGGHPVPVVAPPKLIGATEAMGVWLMLRAFASGCTAMTGVEAVSNGVMAFRDPTYKYAQKTLTIIIAILMIMLIGIAYLAPAYGVAATPPEGPGYESVLSQLLGAITGKGAFYWVSIGSILLVLSLSANTAFADFPRLARAIANNGFLPHSLALRGRRLVYSQGVYALAFLAAVLLTIFGGVTDRLIPLYAVGAFLAFTLSQAGMVIHWRKAERRGCAPQHVHQRPGRGGDRNHCGRGADREIHGRRMDRGRPDSRDDRPDARGEAPLQPCGAGNQGRRADQDRHYSGADHLDPGGALERRLGKGSALRVAFVEGYSHRTYRVRRRHRNPVPGLRRLCRRSGEGGRLAGSRTGGPSIALPVYHSSDIELCAGYRAGQSRQDDRRADSGAGGEPLVLFPAAQQSFAGFEGSAAVQRE